MKLPDLATGAYVAQLIYRKVQQEHRKVQQEQSDEHDQRRVDQGARDVQQATWAYSDLISTQVKWLIGRVVSVNRTAPEIVRFERAAEYYRAQEVFVSTVPPEPDNRTDDEFEQDWEKEHAARDALIEQVRLLADMRNPPPVPLRRRLKSRWQKARPQLKRG